MDDTFDTIVTIMAMAMIKFKTIMAKTKTGSTRDKNKCRAFPEHALNIVCL